MESGSASHVGAMSSRSAASSAWSALFASQSAWEKNSKNCRFIAAWSEPKSR